MVIRLLLAVVVGVTASRCTNAELPVPQPAPPGWEQTMAKVEELRLRPEASKDAVSLLEKVVADTPGFPGGHSELGDAYFSAANDDYAAPLDARDAVFEKAIASLRRAQELGYEPRGDVREKITQVQVRLLEFADVEREARTWVGEQPENPRAWMTLAGALSSQRRPDEGVRLMLEAGSNIPASGQVEHGQNLVWLADLGGVPTDARRRLIAAGQAIADTELAAKRSSVDLDLLRARILTTTADHLEPDPARQRTLRDEADKFLALPSR